MNAHEQHFTLREFIHNDRKPVPFHVAEKLVNHHLLPMNNIRNTSFLDPIFVSLKSGYRTPEHEALKGRNGSAHEFLDNPLTGDNGWGAVDYRVRPHHFPLFIRVMVKHSPYHRIAFYPDVDTPFIHCDYKHIGNRTKGYYVVMEGKWISGTIKNLLDSVDKRFEPK